MTLIDHQILVTNLQGNAARWENSQSDLGSERVNKELIVVFFHDCELFYSYVSLVSQVMMP